MDFSPSLLSSLKEKRKKRVDVVGRVDMGIVPFIPAVLLVPNLVDNVFYNMQTRNYY
jgi:hypothetical protein